MTGTLPSGRKTSTCGEQMLPILENEHLLMVGIMGSGFLSPWPLGQGHAVPWANLREAGRLSYREAHLLTGDRGGCAHQDLHTQALSAMSTEALVPETPAGPTSGSFCPACHRLSGANGSQDFPDPVTHPIQCFSSLSYTPVRGCSAQPVVALLEVFLLLNETCRLIATIHWSYILLRATEGTWQHLRAL